MSPLAVVMSNWMSLIDTIRIEIQMSAVQIQKKFLKEMHTCNNLDIEDKIINTINADDDSKEGTS